MSGDARKKMTEGAVQLLARHGLQATSFSEVLELSGAPRGSVYHHFPEGKDQLVASAMDLAGQRALDFLEKKADSRPEEVTEYFLHIWREVLVRSNFQSGCAVLAVTVATESSELLNRAANIFRAWRGRIAEILAGGGIDGKAASRFAATLVAACEGAVVLSRAEQSMEPFDLVADQLRQTIRGLSQAA